MAQAMKLGKSPIKPPYPNNREFERKHREQNDKLVNYLTTKRGRKAENQQLVSGLQEGSALSHYATNCTARIEFTKSAVSKLITMWNSDKENENVRDYAWLTLTPRFAAFPLSAASGYDWSQLQNWAAEELKGLNYFGIVEAAFFSNLSINDTKESTVSWHLHVIVWGEKQESLRRIIKRVNCMERALIEDKKPAHFRRLKSRKDLACTTRYMLKSMQSDYRVYTRKTGRKDGSKDWDQKKGIIKPGNAIKMFNLFKGVKIEDLCVYSGEGKRLFLSITKSCNRRIEAVEAERQQQIYEAKKGVSLNDAPFMLKEL